ncbi:Carboxymuconolactone decarboxylase [Catenulispora acidiphila DSM 44928]|uniref:Carboxymuconolactone decarboxylase n=1 Tax=Catenulispora acidiphila (strain DSM 44928 / JCM 14897 / NBRC 102108 / NRRL B-24433 / ID139908) TaxID=479433 RepID=C7QAC7_CATAD|nr:carboxymuconolactone decarboxylase family protein [Catenulispora acidiphila]ACU72426.1 Carboxymuconolactone decarboxylase [Catenulispora acidiphila DSM 44928]
MSVSTTEDAATAVIDPMFAQMFGATAGHADAITELTEREKTFLRVTAAVCQAGLGHVFDAYVRLGVEHGVSTSEVRALLRFISYDCGYHAAAAGFERLAAFEARHGIVPDAVEPLGEAFVSTGADAVPSALPETARDILRDLDPHYLEFFDLQSRMRSGHGPDTLTERERGLVCLSIDVHYQTLEESFNAHASRAIRGGASQEEVRAALRFIAQFGATRVWRGWKALNAYFAESV